MTTCAKTTFFLVLGGCALFGDKGTDSRETETGVLVFTDANVAPISGGFTGEALPIATGTELCFDASALGETVERISFMRLPKGDATTRCALGNDTLDFIWPSAYMTDDAPMDGVSCLGSMYVESGDSSVVCDPTSSWVVSVSDGDETTLANRLLDPCVEDGDTYVVIEETAWTETEIAVDFDAVEPLLAKPGVRYTLDWSALTMDGLGEVVDRADPWADTSLMIANVDTAVSLDVAALDPHDSADAYYTFFDMEVISVDLHEAEAWSNPSGDPEVGTLFRGFTPEGKWMLGLDSLEGCLPYNILARVEVED